METGSDILEKETDGEYHFLAILPEKQVSKIEGLYYGGDRSRIFYDPY